MPLNFTCPTCGKGFSVHRKEDAAFRPFCSQRCKLVDLGRWLDGTYNISEPLPEKQHETDPTDASFDNDN